jgi:hypothetical protein
LKQAHPRTFRGLVFYNSVFSTWSEDLKTLVANAVRKI